MWLRLVVEVVEVQEKEMDEGVEEVHLLQSMRWR